MKATKKVTNPYIALVYMYFRVRLTEILDLYQNLVRIYYLFNIITILDTSDLYGNSI